jgi:predicted phosphodiesterase
MLVAVFGDAHAHAEALEAVIAAADVSGARECWSLGDMVGGGPDPKRALALTRERCTVALAGNHDYGATGSLDPLRLGERGSATHRSIAAAAAWTRGSASSLARARCAHAAVSSASPRS